MDTQFAAEERQLTRGPGGRILTNTGVWSPDGRWIVYDTRSDPAGEVFDGNTIERIHVETGTIEVLYRSARGAQCGVATAHPREPRVVFILGPERPTSEWAYGPFHRQGVLVDVSRPSQGANLDARDLMPPFTPGALRGGSHVHVWDASGQRVSFTYEDAILAGVRTPAPGQDLNQRNVGVSVCGRAVVVSRGHDRNHDGTAFTVLATRTTASPRPGSDEIQKAFEESWMGTNGYVRADGTRQRWALAFQGHVVSNSGAVVSEVFVVDLPEDLTRPGDRPLQGTETRLPAPPRGTVQRRLTFTTERRHSGLQGPRHWLRTSPDGAQIACLMKDDAGVVQLWTVSPAGGPPRQLTRNTADIASTFTWSPDGRWIAHVMDRSVCVTEATTGRTQRLTPPSAPEETPRPEACVFSPDGTQIAFVRRKPEAGQYSNQICVVRLTSQTPGH